LEKARPYWWQGQETSQGALQKGPGALAPESPQIDHLQEGRFESSPDLTALQSLIHSLDFKALGPTVTIGPIMQTSLISSKAQ